MNCCMKCCCGPYKDQACGWPPKTVRSLIAILFAIGVLTIEGFLVVYFATHNQENAAIAVGGALLSEFAAIGGFYYGSRSKGTENLEIANDNSNANENTHLLDPTEALESSPILKKVVLDNENRIMKIV